MNLEDCEAPKDPQLSLFSAEIGVLRYLVDALAALQGAAVSTNMGFVSDYCENAAAEIRKAMRAAGG